MAASNERMVSRGRSKRGRVGLERSGSAATISIQRKKAHTWGHGAGILMRFPY